MLFRSNTSLDGMVLAKKQSVRKKLAELETRIEIGYMLFWRTAEMLDNGEDPNV